MKLRKGSIFGPKEDNRTRWKITHVDADGLLYCLPQWEVRDKMSTPVRANEISEYNLTYIKHPLSFNRYL